jgi:hypothetical protein
MHEAHVGLHSPTGTCSRTQAASPWVTYSQLGAARRLPTKREPSCCQLQHALLPRCDGQTQTDIDYYDNDVGLPLGRLASLHRH